MGELYHTFRKKSSTVIRTFHHSGDIFQKISDGEAQTPRCLSDIPSDNGAYEDLPRGKAPEDIRQGWSSGLPHAPSP
jgi:hypothetical protein